MTISVHRFAQQNAFMWRALIGVSRVVKNQITSTIISIHKASHVNEIKR